MMEMIELRDVRNSLALASDFRVHATWARTTKSAIHDRDDMSLVFIANFFSRSLCAVIDSLNNRHQLAKSLILLFNVLQPLFLLCRESLPNLRVLLMQLRHARVQLH
jgi:hypothetical protein